MKVLFWMFIGFDHHATSEHLLAAIIEQLCLQGHSVHILQKNTGGDLPAIPEKLSGYPITTDVISFQSADKGDFVARYLAELRYISASKKYFASDYDAVFIQSTTVAGFAVRALRKKLPNAIITFNVQDIFPYNLMYTGKMKKNSLMFKILAGVQRYGYKQSDHIITISEDMKDTLVEDGTPAKKIDVIYNWSYQDEPYENVDLSSVSHMFEKNVFNVVYAGNIGVMQNVDILLDAARLMKDDKTVWFTIIGDGLYKRQLQQMADNYYLDNISFFSMQDPSLAPAIYSSADVNVIPLARDIIKTALPSKTATCIACQKPIIFAIGRNSVFAKKAADDSGCIIIDSDNAHDLVEAIQFIKTNNYCMQCEKYYLDNFSATNNSKKYADIITGI